MNIDLTRKEFLELKKWINLEVKCAEGYIEKEVNNPKNKVSVEYLQNKLKILKPICDKINDESENIKIKID